MLVAHSHFLHSFGADALDLQLHQTPWQFALSEAQLLPSLLYLLAVLLDSAPKLVRVILPVANVFAQLKHEAVILLMVLLELLRREVRVSLAGELGPLESLPFFAEREDVQKVGEVAVVGCVPLGRQGNLLGNQLSPVVGLLQGVGLPAKQLPATGSHNIIKAEQRVRRDKWRDGGKDRLDAVLGYYKIC